MDHDALGIFFAFGMCVLVPLAVIGGVTWIVLRSARQAHERRMAEIARGPAAPPPAGQFVAAPARPAAPASDPARGMGWAVGLLVCGVLWAIGTPHFACMLIGAGVGFLARGVLGLKRDARSGDGPPRDDSVLPPPGDPR